MNIKSPKKQVYQSPEINSVEIDSDIALTLNSFDDPFEPGMPLVSNSNESMNSTFFNDTL
jgi:hypothetical protein